MTTDDRLTRRQALLRTGAAGLGAGALGLLGCADDESASTTAAPADPPASTTAAPSDGACVLTPEQTEGPYYLPDSEIRSDITDGREGVPLRLELTVQRAESCEPIDGATVEVWHADAAGEYSGVDGAGGELFLRGGQRAGADGRVEFRTIYPGWYPGRATHIHVKVHAGGAEVHTCQLYFPDAVTRAINDGGAYAERGEPDTTNAADGIYGDGGDRSTLALTKSGDGYVGRLTLGVQA